MGIRATLTVLACVVSALPEGLLSGRQQADVFLQPSGGGGGNRFDARCPAGQYLLGFNLRAGHEIDAIRPICGALIAPAVARPGGEMPWYGGDGGQPSQIVCPSHTPVVRGLGVRAEGNRGVVLNNIGIFCGTSNQHVLSEIPSARFDAPTHVGLVVMTVSQFDSTRMCPAGFAAVGVHGSSGARVDSLGLICNAPQISEDRSGRTLGRPDDARAGILDKRPPGSATADATAGRTLGRRRPGASTTAAGPPSIASDSGSGAATSPPADPARQPATLYVLTSDDRVLRYRHSGATATDPGAVAGPEIVSGLAPGPYAALMSLWPYGTYVRTNDGRVRTVQSSASQTVLALLNSLFDQKAARLTEYRHIVASGHGVIYWLQAADGRVDWSRISSDSFAAHDYVARGWPGLRLAFSGGSLDATNTVYGVDERGELWLFNNLNPESSGGDWVAPVRVGSGWETYTHAFSPGGGIIYVVDEAGELFWYRNLAHYQRQGRLEGPVRIGGGWRDVRDVVAAR